MVSCQCCRIVSIRFGAKKRGNKVSTYKAGSDFSDSNDDHWWWMAMRLTTPTLKSNRSLKVCSDLQLSPLFSLLTSVGPKYMLEAHL